MFLLLLPASSPLLMQSGLSASPAARDTAREMLAADAVPWGAPPPMPMLLMLLSEPRERADSTRLAVSRAVSLRSEKSGMSTLEMCAENLWYIDGCWCWVGGCGGAGLEGEMLSVPCHGVD